MRSNSDRYSSKECKLSNIENPKTQISKSSWGPGGVLDHHFLEKIPRGIPSDFFGTQVQHSWRIVDADKAEAKGRGKADDADADDGGFSYQSTAEGGGRSFKDRHL